LRSLGIEIAFSREGKAGERIIKITNAGKSTLPEHRDGEQQSHRRIYNAGNPPSSTEHRNSLAELDPRAS
jgi:hypothetical protein